MTYSPPDPSTYRIPSTARRIAGASLSLIPAVILYVIVPYVGLAKLSQFGVHSGYSLGFIAFAGTILAALGALQSYFRPTSAYGPLSILASGAGVVYLLLLAHSSTASFGVGGGSFALDYAGMMTAFALVPAIRVGSGIVTTVEDLARPKERLPFDYPAPVPVAPSGGP